MYAFESRVRYSEIGADGKLTLEKLIDYFQDCSTFQSEDTGGSVRALREKNLAWMIVYWRVEIQRMPGLGERIMVGTLPYEMKGSIGLRNFLMETMDGERLASANSVWSLIDTSTSRPVRIPPEILAVYPLEERIDMQYDSRKIRIPKEPGIVMPQMTIKEYHLDTNKHVNNGQYVRLAAGVLPPDVVPETLRIEYRRQALLGDVITPVVCDISPAVPDDCVGGCPAEQQAARKVCVSMNADDGHPYAVLEITYRIPRTDESFFH